jgi:hypothetical protein
LAERDPNGGELFFNAPHAQVPAIVINLATVYGHDGFIMLAHDSKPFVYLSFYPCPRRVVIDIAH